MRHRNKIYLALCFALATVHAQQRTEREFSLFSIVTFKNDECSAVSTAGLKGVCQAADQCTDAGGSADGNCASGFGVCCVTRINTCGGSVTTNCSYIENPGWPSTFATSGACAYTVTRAQDDICQIRLDFFNVNLMQPSTTAGATAGDCVNTILAITPGSTSRSITSTPPPVCGLLTGSHMYVDSGRQATAATLTFTLTAASPTNTWRVKVSQLECGNPSKAPNGCLQYFYGGSRNTVSSFNFDGTNTCVTGCLLTSQMYSVCFRPEKGFCSQYYTQTNVASPLDSWDLPQLADDAVDEEGDMETAANCGNGWVNIINILPANDSKFCGTGGLSPTVAATLPGTIDPIPSAAWNFDVVITGDIEAVQGGFSIDAHQTPCGSG